MQKVFPLGWFGSLSLSLSAGVASASLGGGKGGTSLSASQDLAVLVQDGFAWVNTKLPPAAAPIEAVVEGSLIAALKALA